MSPFSWFASEMKKKKKGAIILLLTSFYLKLKVIFVQTQWSFSFYSIIWASWHFDCKQISGSEMSQSLETF